VRRELSRPTASLGGLTSPRHPDHTAIPGTTSPVVTASDVGTAVERATAKVDEALDLPLDEPFLGELQSFVFEQAGRPNAYAVQTRYTRVEAGASGALGQIIIELADDANNAAWEALAALVAGWLGCAHLFWPHHERVVLV